MSRKLVAIHSGRTLIISGEDLCVFDPASVGRMADFLKGYFSRIEVIGYVRAPGSYMQSAFQQNAKSFAPGISDRVPTVRYRNYRKMFEKYDKCFSRENVNLFKFESAIEEYGNVVEHFISQIGLESMALKNLFFVNQSICRLTAQFLFCYHQYFPVRGKEFSLDPIIRIIDNTKCSVSPSLLKRLVESNIEDVLWMEERLGESLRESFGEDSPDDFSEWSQLLQPRQEHIDALRVLTCGRVTPKSSDGSPEEVALMVRELLTMTDLSVRPARDTWAELCRDVALKVQRGSKLDLNDALSLMRIAKEIRPHAPFISRKVIEWEKALESRDELT